jgi:quinoprotein glucose dehydrogenase
MMFRTGVITALAFLLTAQPAAAENIDWPYYGGDEGGKRHSSASQITPENVAGLEVAWVYRTGDVSTDAYLSSSFQNTPLMINGSLYVCSPFNRVIALNAASGEEQWTYDPQIDRSIRYGNHNNCRGLAFWKSANTDTDAVCQQRLVMATNDARLIALDAKTGLPCPNFGNNGVVSMGPTADLVTPGEFQVSSAPVIVGDVVIVGSAISDNWRADAPPGTVRAYDLHTGAPRWQFDPLIRPTDGDFIAGHANVWSSLSVDSARGLVFLPTGSASPDFYGAMRPGDNRHASSVVALRSQTGEIVWAFQTIHHDVWDGDVPAQPLLATINHNGQQRDVVIQATKTGFLFVLDRDSGEPVFEVTEQPVPQEGAPGEFLSPTQPIPALPEPLVPQELSAEDAWGFTFFDRAICAEKIRNARSEGLYTPPSTQGTILFPGTGGGANWGGGAYDNASGLYIINTSRVAHLVTLIPRVAYEAASQAEPGGGFAPQHGTAYDMRRELLLSPFGIPCNPPPWGVLSAVDMSTGKIVWESTLGTTEDIAPLGLALKLGTPNFGGPLITAGGLVFIGATMDDYLRAFSLRTGAEIWKGRLPAGGQATPMSYVSEGRQYVVIAAGGHGMSGTRRGDYVIAFALPLPDVN